MPAWDRYSSETSCPVAMSMTRWAASGGLKMVSSRPESVFTSRWVPERLVPSPPMSSCTIDSRLVDPTPVITVNRGWNASLIVRPFASMAKREYLTPSASALGCPHLSRMAYTRSVSSEIPSIGSRWTTMGVPGERIGRLSKSPLRCLVCSPRGGLVGVPP